MKLRYLKLFEEYNNNSEEVEMVNRIDQIIMHKIKDREIQNKWDREVEEAFHHHSVDNWTDLFKKSPEEVQGLIDIGSRLVGEAGEELEESEVNEKVTKEAREFISKKISKFRDEGMEQDQAVAAAYTAAREAGYKIPEAPKK